MHLPLGIACDVSGLCNLLFMQALSLSTSERGGN